jgi:thioredoxin 1
MVRRFMGWETKLVTKKNEKKERQSEKTDIDETTSLSSTTETSHKNPSLPPSVDESNTTTLGEGMDFQEVISSSPFVICRFTAKWCKPCHALEPIFYEAAGKNPDVKFVTVDVDEHDELFSSLGIFGIPHLQCYASGELKTSLSGNNASNITETIEEMRRDASLLN